MVKLAATTFVAFIQFALLARTTTGLPVGSSTLELRTLSANDRQNSDDVRLSKRVDWTTAGSGFMAGVVAHHVYKPVYRYAQTATRYGTKKVKQLMGWEKPGAQSDEEQTLLPNRQSGDDLPVLPPIARVTGADTQWHPMHTPTEPKVAGQRRPSESSVVTHQRASTGSSAVRHHGLGFDDA